MDVEQWPPQNREIPNEDWERTPLSVKTRVESLEKRLEQLEQQLAELKAQNELRSRAKESHISQLFNAPLF